MSKHLFIKITYYYLVFQTVVLAMFVVVLSKSFIPNINFFIIGSGSMSPSLSKNSLIITQKQIIYFKNDIITFIPSRPSTFSTLTHRINSLGGNVYVTKGDANLGIDRSLVLPDQIIGSVIYTSLLLGNFYLFLKTDLVLTVLIYLPALTIVYSEIRKIGHFVKIQHHQSIYK